jgi:hypothetical protein
MNSHAARVLLLPAASAPLALRALRSCAARVNDP